MSSQPTIKYDQPINLARPGLGGPEIITAGLLAKVGNSFQIIFYDHGFRQPLAKKCKCGNYFLIKESRGDECPICLAKDNPVLQIENAH
jgi:hypothetical protein